MTQQEFLQDLEAFLQEWQNDEPTVWVHTSGSTGTPKPLRVEKERMMASARLTCSFLGLKEGDSALLCMPLQYIAGKMVVVRSLEAGLRLIPIAPSGHPLKDLKETPTFAAMIPMQVYNTLQVPEERAILMEIKHLIIGGGAIDDALAHELKDFPNHVWSTYGMTETLSHIALRSLNGVDASDSFGNFRTLITMIERINFIRNGYVVTFQRGICKKNFKVFRLCGIKFIFIITKVRMNLRRKGMTEFSA